MPIYEYRCEACGEEFEELVSATADSPPCPKCKSKKTGKLLSCCRFKTEGDFVPKTMHPSMRPKAASSGGCAGCSGGSCATCK